jgi:hypothetical protein
MAEGRQTICVSSRALGPRVSVTVYVYDTVEAMRTAASAYNGTNQDDSLGVTQCRTDENGRVGSVLVRLVRGHLNTQIVVHEMHHASTAWYGAHVGDRVSRRAHLNHYNEPFAHLHSDLTQHLVDRLYELGYYAAS